HSGFAFTDGRDLDFVANALERFRKRIHRKMLTMSQHVTEHVFRYSGGGAEGTFIWKLLADDFAYLVAVIGYGSASETRANHDAATKVLGDFPNRRSDDLLSRQATTF